MTKIKNGSQASGSRRKKSSLTNRIYLWIARILMAFFILSIGSVLLYRFIPVYYTPLMFIRLVQQAKDGKHLKLDRTWKPIDKISPNLVNAVVSSEDNLFMQHNGFDVDGIIRAYKHNLKHKKMQGGSTISQQTAKNVFLFPDRSIVRKGLEAYFTVLIEFCWTKERIMEVYLNVIEMGDGIYGAEAASKAYFDKPAENLTKSQAASIAVCLPNPRKFNPEHPSAYVVKRRHKVLQIMSDLGPVNLTQKVSE